MPSTTPNLSLNKGSHGDWLNFWEIPLNQNWDILDVLFDAALGHSHTGLAGQGPSIDHTNLLNAGVLSHAQLDTASSKTKVSAGDTTDDYLEPKIQAGANVVITKLNPGANETLEIAAPAISPSWSDDDVYGDKTAVPTSAPVAYTDNFNWPMGFLLKNAGYAIETFPLVSTFDFVSTGYSAKMFVNPPGGDPTTGTWNAVTLCHIPHSPAQRATLSITDFDAPTDVGDSVCFTLGVYATQRVGTHLPQKYGVFLEIHATCTAPAVYQVSHRVVVLPDDTTRIEFPACIHSDIADVKGCWELSLDQHGHVYVYWRRTLVYTTQTNPVSTPGPVQTYFATLTASLVAVNEPPYGSIGYGMRYVLSPYSTMNIEIRWFTATATDDLYHETAVCAGIPLVGPSLPDFTEEFLTMPAGDGSNGIPGSACCMIPDPKTVGDVLAWDSGVPSVWIAACGLYEGSTLPGYITNVSNVVTPCAYLVAGTVAFNFTSGEDPWQEGTRGTAIISGVSNLMPSVQVAPSLPSMQITNAERLSDDKLLIEFEISDGLGGQAPDLTISDSYRPANSLVISAPTIAEAPLSFTSITFTRQYDDSVAAGLLEGVDLDYVMTVVGANPAATVTTATPGVAVTSVYVSPTTIIGTIKVALQAFPPAATSVDLDITNGGPIVTASVPVVEPAPLIYSVEADTNLANSNPVNVTITGNLFRVGVAVTVLAGDFTITLVTRISDTQISVQGSTGPGGSPNVEFTVSNGPGLDTNVDIMTIGAIAPLFAAATPIPQAGVKGTVVNISGLQFFNSTNIAVSAGLSVDPLAPYASPGNTHVVARGVNNFDVIIDPAIVDGGNPVNVWLINPGAVPLLVSPMFSVTATLAPAGLAILPLSAMPGETILGATITGANINTNTTLSTASPFLVISNVVPVLGTITFDLVVDTSAPNYVPQPISVDNPGGLSTVINISITEPNPAFTSVECEFPFHGRQDQDIILHGTNLLAGGVLSAVAGCTLDSFTRISDIEVRAVLDLQVAANAQVQWINPGGGVASISQPLVAEPAPEIFHTSVLLAQEGAVNQDMYIYGRYLDPTKTGMVLTLAGATLLSTVTWTDTYIHAKVTITGLAGTDVTAFITGSIAYPSFYVATITAGAPAPSITSIVVTPADPPEEAGVSTITINGSGLLAVSTIEVWPSVPRLGVDYLPFGVANPGTIAITAQNDGQIVGTLTLGAALKPWSLDLQFYDAGAVLILTAASAITPTSFTGLPNPAPVIVNTAVLDTILEVSVVPQSIVFQMQDPIGMFIGETWTGFNVTVIGAVPGPGPNDWTVNFFITAPGPYTLYCYRSVLLNPDRCTAVGITGSAI